MPHRIWLYQFQVAIFRMFASNIFVRALPCQPPFDFKIRQLAGRARARIGAAHDLSPILFVCLVATSRWWVEHLPRALLGER